MVEALLGFLVGCIVAWMLARAAGWVRLVAAVAFLGSGIDVMAVTDTVNVTRTGGSGSALFYIVRYSPGWCKNAGGQIQLQSWSIPVGTTEITYEYGSTSEDLAVYFSSCGVSTAFCGHGPLPDITMDLLGCNWSTNSAPTLTNQWSCITLTNTSQPAGQQWTLYACTNGSAPIEIGRRYVWMNGGPVTVCVTNHTQGVNLTCFYGVGWRADSDLQDRVDGAINEGTDEEEEEGTPSVPDDPNLDGDTNNAPWAQLIEEVKRLNKETTQRGMSNLLSSRASDAMVSSLKTNLSNIQSTLNSNAAQAHLDAAGLSNLLSSWTNQYSTNLAGTNDGGYAASNAWRSLGIEPAIAATTNIVAVPHVSLWAIPARTSIFAGTGQGFIDLDPRKAKVWSLAPWVHWGLSWGLLIAVAIDLFGEGRKKLVEAIHTVPGSGFLQKVASFGTHLATGGTTLLGAAALWFGVISLVISTVALFMGPILAPLVLGPFSSAGAELLGELSPHLEEALSLILAWVPLELGAWTFCWYVGACIALDGVMIAVAYVAKGVVT